MSRRGFLALIGALVLTLAVMIGAWSFSMATVISEGTLKITSGPDALVGTPTFGLSPFVVAQRAGTNEGRFPITVRTANPVVLSASVRNADQRLGAVLAIDGTECVVQISPLGQPSFPIGMYIIQATVIAQGSGFRAAIDVDVPVEVLNSPIIANADSAITAAGAQVSIPVLTNDNHPDGDMVITAVNAAGTDGTVEIDGDVINFLPADGFTGTTTFEYTISHFDGGVATESATATVTVTVTE